NALETPASETRLFPLNCSRRFARYVINHPVYALNAIGNSGGRPREDVMRQSRPVRCHEVIRFNRPKRHDAFVGPSVSHHPPGLNRKHPGNRLGDRPVYPGFTELLEKDSVALPQDFEPLFGHLSQTSDREPWSWKRVSPDDRVGQAELDSQP